MAGYFRKLNGRVYDGSHKAGEELTNGLFVENTASDVKKITATKDLEFSIVEKTKLFGKLALAARLVKLGNDEVYFTENEWDINDATVYNTADYSVKTGDFVKMRRPELGDEIVQSVTQAVYDGCDIGTVLKPASGGLLIQGAVAAVLSVDLSATDTATVGTSKTLTVTASVSDGGTLSYQWYKDGETIASATSTTYTMASPATTDSGVYHCVITNTKNSVARAISSTKCTLTVS